MTTAEQDLRATDVAWDVEPLVDGQGEAGVDAFLDAAAQRAAAFTRYRGRVGSLDAVGLAEAVHELAELSEIMGKAGSYAGLRFAVDVTDPSRGALLARVEERATAITNDLPLLEL
ncbi:MAG: oligoendopeptidase, partial [Acidimicrobiia bacterium]